MCLLVETMRYVNIVGAIGELDRVIEQYISKYDIQLEYAHKELNDEGLYMFAGQNPYAQIMQKCERFKKLFPFLDSEVAANTNEMTGERAVKIIDVAYQMYERREVSIKEIEAEREAYSVYLQKLELFESLEFDIKHLLSLEFISYSFGRMPISNFRQFETFLYHDPEILYVESKRDSEYIYGVYFTPEVYREKADSIFSSLHFERIDLNVNAIGWQKDSAPSDVISAVKEHLAKLDTSIKNITIDIRKTIEERKDDFLCAFNVVKDLYFVFETKKYAVKTKNNFFIFVGWMAERDALSLQAQLERDDLVMLNLKSGEVTGVSTPPTKLRNPSFLNFFSFFVDMYGLPSYDEIDPTPIIAITYTLLFGLMFGDVGQGAVIALVGFLLYKLKGMKLGGIMTVIGVSSIIFGFLYGSIFGLEELIPTFWRKPAHDINSTLIFAVGVGMVLILSSMLLHCLNAIKQKKWADLIFDQNGIAGMVFYGAVVYIAYDIFLRQSAVSMGILAAIIGLPLLLIAFKHPIHKILHGLKTHNRERIIESGPVMFVFETVIELFETLLTYFTNTISFVRVGAFALSHAGMMGVVLLLAHTANGTDNIFVIIFGNILVMVLEGLIVGIQVLRLNFYELFSRFYHGDGRRFVSYRAEITSQ